jgi:hypothetical protein
MSFSALHNHSHFSLFRIYQLQVLWRIYIGFVIYRTYNKLCSSILKEYSFILWLIDPSLGKALETDETTVAMRRCSNHNPITTEISLKTVLCNQLLDSCNRWTTAMEKEVFSMWSTPRSFLEENWGGQVSCQLSVVSCQLGVEFCTRGCEDRTWACEA